MQLQRYSVECLRELTHLIQSVGHNPDCAIVQLNNAIYMYVCMHVCVPVCSGVTLPAYFTSKLHFEHVKFDHNNNQAVYVRSNFTYSKRISITHKLVKSYPFPSAS